MIVFFQVVKHLRAKGSLNLEALYALCTNLSNKVLALETIKDAQAKEILTLKARIKKLEKRCKPSISHHQAWLRSVSLFSKKKRLSKRKSVSKQGRKNAKSGPTKDGSDKLNAELDEEMKPDVSTARQELSTVGQTTTPTTPTTSTIFVDEEMTLIDTLIKLKDDKAKGVSFKDSESTYRPARSILTLKPLLIIDPKDKRKGVLEEPESAKKMTKSDFDAAQIARDEEIARQLEVEMQVEVERERQREEQTSMDYIENLYDEVQERIDADHEFTYSQLNKKSFKDIQGLYMKEHELIVDFVPIGFDEDERMIRDMNKKAKEESSDKGVGNIKKRKEGSRMKKMSKRQKTDVDLEEEEKLKTFLKIDPDEERVIDYEAKEDPFQGTHKLNTLIKLKDDKAKGVAFKDSESTDRHARSILTLKPLLTIDPKDKKKGVLEEPESSKKINKIQARIDVDHELAVIWTHEEHDKYTVDERAKLLAEYFERRKKQLAEERADAIRNKPPTKTQLRRLMMTYLKNMDFIPTGSKEDERMIRGMNKKAKEESSDKDGNEIHMLVERRYPLTTRTLKRMMSLRLIVESASDVAYDLFKNILMNLEGMIEERSKELASPKQTAL
nr:hypothetical protein [Tanacetum cinerariifolium]